MWRCCAIPSVVSTYGGGDGGGDAAAVGVVAAVELGGSGVVDWRLVFLLFLPMRRCCNG